MLKHLKMCLTLLWWRIMDRTSYESWKLIEKSWLERKSKGGMNNEKWAKDFMIYLWLLVGNTVLFTIWVDMSMSILLTAIVGVILFGMFGYLYIQIMRMMFGKVDTRDKEIERG